MVSKIDTGADVTVVTLYMVKSLNIETSGKRLSGTGYTVLPVVGQFMCLLEHTNAYFGTALVKLRLQRLDAVWSDEALPAQECSFRDGKVKSHTTCIATN